MNDLQKTGGSVKDIATENGGASKIARDGCSGPSWCELTPSDRRSSSSVHQLASLGVAGGRGHRRVIHETIERAGGNKQNASHHVTTFSRHEQPLQFRTAMWGYLPLFNHTCPLCKDYTRPTNPILHADQFGRGYSLIQSLLARHVGCISFLLSLILIPSGWPGMQWHAILPPWRPSYNFCRVFQS